ncbi:hypothetical protein NPX13_g6457 [Xylaria arbuscula]|uniref:Uncharacterized protein n=1 Tax=Xylaria arbuscula TaxID=114810 RepID=A0A9W8NBU0_9PEZI|nr:hypothetical protein NPX13_g6457 [Xylaria arbuscula]
MASVASASPSRPDYPRANSSTEDTDSWQYVESSSPGFTPSPGSSYNGWGLIGYPNHLGASPPIMSPLQPPTSHPNQQSSLSMTGGDSENHFLSFLDNQQLMESQELLFPNLLDGTMNNYQLQQGVQEDSMGDLTGFEGMDGQPQPADLGIPLQFQQGNNVDPWAPEFMFFDVEDLSALKPKDSLREAPNLQGRRSNQEGQG